MMIVMFSRIVQRASALCDPDFHQVSFFTILLLFPRSSSTALGALRDAVPSRADSEAKAEDLSSLSPPTFHPNHMGQ